VRLGNETLESFFDPDNVDSVVQLIFNHAVSGVYPSSLLDDGLSLENEAGNPMMYSRSSNGSFMVNDANIVRVDILANNGIFRAIDKVFLTVSVPSIAENGTMQNTTAPSAATAANGPTMVPKVQGSSYARSVQCRMAFAALAVGTIAVFALERHLTCLLCLLCCRIVEHEGLRNTPIIRVSRR
jgi:Fasciclin domain